VIEAGKDVFTLVVVFTVEAERQQEFVDLLERVAAWHSTFPGFISNSILRSRDGVRVTEYIQWETEADMQAMRATPGAMDHLRTPGVVSEAHSYIVSSVTER